MIIACPECSGPFEIPAEHIAELVQIECPHCAFRMILDFAAANDPNLVEDGMQMASGFRSAADYRAWSTPAAAPAAPRHLEPVADEPEPKAPAAEAPAVEAPAPEPMARPRAARMTPPGRPAGGVATLTHPEVAAVQAAAARTGGTVVGPAPVPPPAHAGAEASSEAAVVDDVVEAEAPAARTPPTTPPEEPTTQTARPQPVETEVELDEEPAAPTVDEREVEPPAAKAVVERTPPHTPPAPKATSRSTEGEPVPAVPSETSATDLDVYEKQLHGGRAGTVLLVILLLMAGGLVAASVALEGTPDPRPLLEDLYRQAFKS